VPICESVPLRPLLGWLVRHTKAAGEDRHRGSGQQVLHAGSLAVGPLISFEVLFPDLPRREVQLGAQLLVYQSSTSTYQGSWAQPQLASVVAVRAAEVGHPAVYAGLSGGSTAFDPRGRKIAWCPSSYRGAIVVSVPLGSHTTGFQRLGEWVPALAFAILVSAGVLAGVRSRGLRRGVHDQYVDLGAAGNVGGHGSQQSARDRVQADVADDEEIGVDLLGESDERVDRGPDD
jgi:apolipoprotein N-acyltransferase